MHVCGCEFDGERVRGLVIQDLEDSTKEVSILRALGIDEFYRKMS